MQRWPGTSENKSRRTTSAKATRRTASASPQMRIVFIGMVHGRWLKPMHLINALGNRGSIPRMRHTDADEPMDAGNANSSTDT